MWARVTVAIVIVGAFVYVVLAGHVDTLINAGRVFASLVQ